MRGPHRIVVTQRKGASRYMTGATTEVTIDGKPFRGLKSISFDAQAKGLALVTVELYAEFGLDGEIGVLNTVAVEPSTLLTRRQVKALRESLGR